MNILKQIEIFGDSILKGVIFDKITNKYLTPKETHADRVENFLPVSISNKSRFGCTIDKGDKMLDKTLNEGVDCDIILLEYGGNDCDFDWKEVSEHPEKEHQPKTPLNIFEKTLRSMINKVKEHGIKPLVMSLPPIDPHKYINWITKDGLSKERILQWLGDVNMIYRFQELYSNTVVKIAYETKCLFVDVRSKFLDKHNFSALLCDDGIHPNALGHKLIEEAFVDYGKEKLELNDKKINCA